LSISSQARLPNLRSVGSDLYISSQARLPNLRSVGGYLYISSQALPFANKIIDRILETKRKRNYYLEGVKFNLDLFNKVRKGKLSAKEVFSLENIEQRRIAYQIMDKAKMKDLENYKILNRVKDDGYGYKMLLVSFTQEGYDTPFKYLNCFCPSTGREYFLETDKDTCWKAKYESFGIDRKNYKFNKEA
jgi:hypothetical protein